ncbi:MAG TPA: hypothetical protein VE172_05955 [Stackebrandtia sp.]|jgi:thiosulfate dehydrogenase [quinone] large subunit|uniref:hypothetical protein n=1 Tax=Stackebrandtia sp. TaxID=2023065 RepID=UPI002D6EB0D7|nr:hypothetical protein [Stackebrandtia sp.]HZE38339.1 hypothetical protein [Stackebrandtia sp.]
MTTTHRTEHHGDVTLADAPRDILVRRIWAVARIAVGWIFLWAFVDKLFGLGFATPGQGAWLQGGSPTEGFLAHSASGPFKDLYTSIAGAGWADWLFMLGLLGIGAALILGIGMRIATIGGAVLLVLMWTVVMPPETNPVIDDHIIMAILLLGLAAARAGDTWGLGARWKGTSLVKSMPFLR